MNSPAYDLARYLAEQGAGVFAGRQDRQWTVNVSREPDAPVLAVTLYDTGGQGPDTDELDLFRPTIQVRVRSEQYAEGDAKQRAIMALLHSLGGTEINGTRYVGVHASSDVLPIGVNENNAYLFTVNYDVIRE